ncbi:MAG TPA: RNA polymerase sigma-70 factor [Gemmatimonadaceae bacterium]|nr:RNA polymerase sigma-70 factor [Gemmatimonadaceae bacterium]
MAEPLPEVPRAAFGTGTSEDPASREESIFERHRPRLFAIAYRMLGSVEDAEDMVQETFLRWQVATHDEIRTPAAWLSTVVTRLALNYLQLSRTRREQYVGPWLPEPLPTDQVGADERLELADSLSLAFLTVMERLNPRERAVFVLRDVFDYEYDEIGQVLQLTAANCRQLFHRAKVRLGQNVRRFRPDRALHARLLAEFAYAVRHGDIDSVVQLLAEDATLYVDSGGVIRAAARRPVRGALAIAKFLSGVTRKVGPAGLRTMVLDINGEPALVTAIGSSPRQVLTIVVSGGRIRGISVVANPEKLRRVELRLHALAAAAVALGADPAQSNTTNGVA